MTKTPPKYGLVPGTPRDKRRIRLMVGWLLKGSDVTEHPDLLPLLIAEARERGWRLIDMNNANWRMTTAGKLHGALIQDLPGSALVKDLESSGCPTVRFGRFPHPDDGAPPAVLPDIEASGRLAAHHFAERGFRRVAYIRHRHAVLRLKMYDGFRSEAEILGMECSAFHTESSPDAPTGHLDHYARRRRAFISWLKRQPKPLGILFQGDSAAGDLEAWIMEAGMQVPLEVALLGRGNCRPVCESLFPSLSSIDTDEQNRLHTACDLLEQLIAGEKAPQNRIFVPPKRVVERESTNTLGVQDVSVARAVRFMWTNLDRDISVDDVAQAVGVHRRALERSFRIHLNRGINAELLRKRLEVLAELLLNTNETLDRLGSEVGFRHSSHLHRAFKRAYGMSPRQYRKAHQKESTHDETPKE